MNFLFPPRLEHYGKTASFHRKTDRYRGTYGSPHSVYSYKNRIQRNGGLCIIVALYARVSARKQDETDQLPRLNEAARNRGYMIYREYSDEASAKDANRPGWKDLMRDASMRTSGNRHITFYIDSLSSESVPT